MSEKVFNLLTDVPVIHNTDELQLWIKPLYIVDNYLQDRETYNDVITKLTNVIRGCYVIRECREFPIKFKFYQNSKDVYTLELRHFYVNMIMWGPFVCLHGTRTLDKSFIFDCSKDVPYINDYINEKIITILRDFNIKSTDINYNISSVLYNLRNISMDFSLIMGLNFSLQTFLDDYYGDDEMRSIMDTTLDESMQPAEIESKLKGLQERAIEIYKSKHNHPVGVLLRANTGVKHKQLAEFTIADGLMPTLEGVTVPEPIENSLLIKGFDRPSYLYIAAIGSRKSLVLNKKVMGKAGYFGKIVLLLARSLSMSTSVADCGSTHLVEYEVKTKKHLKKLDGKYYKLNKDDDDLTLLDSKKSTHLIGKKIYARSAMTCKLGDCVCPRCVGHISVANLDIADGIAGFESEEITKVVNQSILSTKHLLTTSSEEIVFNSDFYKFFSMVGGEINPIINDNKEVDIERYAIYIDPEDLIKLEEQDYDSQFNNCIEKGRFYIRDTKGEQPDILIQNEGEKEIFLSEEANLAMTKGKGLIYFKDLDDDTKLFELVILNKELTKSLYDLMNLLNKNSEEENGETIESMSQKFLDLLVESGIDANVVAAELISNRLIRSDINRFERPDFGREELEPYRIVTVSHALEHNKSPLLGMSFENIKKQLLSDDLFEERDSSSYIDPLFWEDIPTNNLKKYSHMVSKDYTEKIDF